MLLLQFISYCLALIPWTFSGPGYKEIELKSNSRYAPIYERKRGNLYVSENDCPQSEAFQRFLCVGIHISEGSVRTFFVFTAHMLRIHIREEIGVGGENKEIVRERFSFSLYLFVFHGHKHIRTREQVAVKQKDNREKALALHIVANKSLSFLILWYGHNV